MFTPAIAMRTHMTQLTESFTRDQITKFLNKCGITVWETNSDGKIDIDGHFIFLGRLKQFPVEFGTVNGSFSCGGSGVTTLEGGPIICNGRYSCANTAITSLIGSPALVRGGYICNNTKITSLVGAPTTVDGNFNCQSNNLISLDGLPKHIGGQIFITWTKDLPLLRLVGRNTEFTLAYDTQTNLTPLIDIFKKFDTPSRSNILSCQKELIAAGFEGNASW